MILDHFNNNIDIDIAAILLGIPTILYKVWLLVL